MRFNYLARTTRGESQNGVIEANSRQSAIDALQAKGLLIMGLEAEVSAPMFARKITIFQRVSQKELVAFSRQLAILFTAQVPLLESMRALAQQTENSYFAEIIFQVATEVEGGTAFSGALSDHPKVFSSFFINMIKSGEASGGLVNSLQYLADYLERQYYLMTKVRGAMIYPAFITSAFAAVAVVMMIVVIPKLKDFMAQAGQSMPFTTQIIIGASDFLVAWWWLLVVILSGGGFYLYYIVKHSPAMHARWDAVKLRIPVFGKRVLQKLYLTRFAENLSTLIEGGLTVLQSLNVSAEVIGNAVYRDVILRVAEEVRVGEALSTALSHHKEIPPLVIQMAATGERTGSLDFILSKMAQFYGKEIDATVDNISQLIEPVLILVIGGAVALLVTSILMPIYNIANSM